MFESVGIGPAGAEPVEYVDLDVDDDDNDDSGTPNPARNRTVLLGLGVSALVVVIVWTTLRSSTPEYDDSWSPRLPTDPTRAFVWTGTNGEEDQISVAGSADDPYVMTVGPTSGTIVALDDAGAERWRADLGRAYYADAYTADDTIVAVTQDHEPDASALAAAGSITVTGLDRTSGNQKWQTTLAGDYWREVDGHIVVVAVPATFEAVGDGPTHLERPTFTVGSVAMASGKQTASHRYNDIVDDGASDELLVRLDDTWFTIDGALEPTSTPVPAGSGRAGVGPDSILAFDDGGFTLYDRQGEQIRSTKQLPEGLDGDQTATITGATSDLWLFASFTTAKPECGVFRFADGDDIPVELWRQENCFVSVEDGSTDVDSDSEVPYGRLFAAGIEPGADDVQHLIDLTTGASMIGGQGIAVAANGTAVSDGERIVGWAPDANGNGEPLFELPTTGEAWFLIGGAIAIPETTPDGKPVSVTFYR